MTLRLHLRLCITSPKKCTLYSLKCIEVRALSCVLTARVSARQRMVGRTRVNSCQHGCSRDYTQIMT